MDKYDFTKDPAILIQGAMETETDYLIGELKQSQTIELGNWKFVTGFMGKYEEPVIISRTYQGMVNAAAATSLALFYFNVRALINQGIGGGHDTSFHVGDIVIGEKIVPYGAMIRRFSERGTGISESDFEPLPIEVFCRNEGTTMKLLDFPCDKGLVSLAENVKTMQNVRKGVIGSADEWNNQLDRIALLRERYGTTVEDMESAAAAELCLSYGIPFIGIRILSNSIVNGEEFDESVGVDGQKFIQAYIDRFHEF
jgi:adenosylhomocysteine nucleosidase